jgi:predicted O-methyltransferase YrrM
VWGLAFAAADPGVRLVAVDRAEVVEKVTRQYAARAGLAERCSFRTGNLRDVDFGTGEFDLVILGHVLHSEGRSRSLELLARAHRCLRP